MSTNLTFTDTSFKIGANEIDIGKLPEISVRALISRGLTHYLGSEQASKVKAKKDAYEKDNGGVAAAEDEIAAWKAEFVAQAIEKLVAGSIGVRAVGTTVDPVEAMSERIAKEQVLEILRANGIKVPKKDEAVSFADGSTKSLDDMIATRLEKNGEAIEREAKKRLTDKAKKEAAAKVAGEVKTFADLGL